MRASYRSWLRIVNASYHLAEELGVGHRPSFLRRVFEALWLWRFGFKSLRPDAAAQPQP